MRVLFTLAAAFFYLVGFITSEHRVLAAVAGAPTAEPTAEPTAVRSYATQIPTSVPTMSPTSSNGTLFAVVGGMVCAQTLPYGPLQITRSGSEDGENPYYLSTDTPGKNVNHTEWLQIVTSDGATELFRVYWSFDTPRTLAQHFIHATKYGSKVSYRVVQASTGMEYHYSATWYYSSGASGMDSKFATTTSTCCFSQDDGVWGAGTGTLQPDGNAYGYQASFWGIGNWDSTDGNSCRIVYENGQGTSLINSKAYLYHSFPAAPTPSPTSVPTAPTPTPTLTPTITPTVTMTFPPIGELFAIVGGTHCAESLYYGPQAITSTGSADGLYEYFLSTSTFGKDVPHKYWTQVVTSDGTTELFTIYWTFATARTLEQHFIVASTMGEAVSFKVVTAAGDIYSYTGTWWFSNGAYLTPTKFNTLSSTCCFSSDDGVWGAGVGVIQPNGYPNNWQTTFFWGLGNWDASDADCSYIIMNGNKNTLPSYGYNTKAYMYYSIPHQGPSASPTTAPSSPTVAPSIQPTYLPTRSPTSHSPTAAPSAIYVANAQLFAVVGGSQCAESLPYGPSPITSEGSADGTYPYFLSTNTPAGNNPHSAWIQVVTIDGVNELFRIYWYFTTPKTLKQRFLDAVAYGESVRYVVIEKSTGLQHELLGTWRFSDSASLTNKFDATSSFCCFSSDDGTWGAAVGTVNGNAGSSQSTNFWGIANFDSSDSVCSNIYQSGSIVATFSSSKTFMYVNMNYTAPGLPSAAPTTRPTYRPSAAPTRPPPSTPPGYHLFAVLGAGGCAESLYYGPEAITTAGSVFSKRPYFLSTNVPYSNQPHTKWVQIVTSDGKQELFRIYWTFQIARTIAERFDWAINRGDYVSYRIVYPDGRVYLFGATWSYSTYAKITQSMFDADRSTTCCFSANGGAWGGSNNSINGGSNYSPTLYYGIGNFNSIDGTCGKVYEGQTVTTYANNKVYMYFSPPVGGPTLAPTMAPPNLKVQVEQEISGVDYGAYSSNPTGFEAVIKASIVDSLPEISTSDIRNFDVTAGQAASATAHLSHTPHTTDAEISHRSPSTDLVRRGKRVAPSQLRAGHFRPLSSSSSIFVNYKIVLSGNKFNYDDVTDDLEMAVYSGKFQNSLQYFAQDQGVTALSSATSSDIDTTNDTGSDDDYAADDDDSSGSSSTDSSFPLEAIIPIVIGGAFGVILLLWSCYAFCRRSSDSTDSSPPPGERPIVGHQPDNNTLAKDINMYFYGAGISSAQGSLVPSAPPTRYAAGDGEGGIEGDGDVMLHERANAPSMDMLYPPTTEPETHYHNEYSSTHAQQQQHCESHTPPPSIPVAAVAVAAPAYGPARTDGPPVAIAHIYMGEIEESKT